MTSQTQSTVSSSGSPSGAMTGYRVIELGGPLIEWCGRLLAMMGAEVIKVEPPGGAATRDTGPFVADIPDPERSLYFWHYNAGKRSVTLDIDQADGLALLHGLIRGADVLLEALAPGGAARPGLDHAALERENPGLVTCSVTPFGPDGPYAHLRTTDLISMALGGPMQSCGYDSADPELPPVRPGAYHSFHTAGHFACTGILAALYEREGSGRGQHLEIAAHDCLAVMVEFANTFWYYRGEVVRRQTGRHAMIQPTARTQYLCADGRYVNLGLPRDERAWKALLTVIEEKGIEHDLDDPALLDPANRFAAASRAYDLLEILCATHTAEELFHLGQSIGLTWGAVRAPEDWLNDPHAVERGFLVEVAHPEIGRSVTYPGAPFIAPASPLRIERRAPLVGEDYAAVYGALGLGDAELADLAARGVV